MKEELNDLRRKIKGSSIAIHPNGKELQEGSPEGNGGVTGGAAEEKSQVGEEMEGQE